MPLLSRKGLLAIAAVIDVAMNGRGRPVSAKVLATRHALPTRHLEPVLQALVRDGILRGVRGPRGGYELARERRRITANEILRAAGSIDNANGEGFVESRMVVEIVRPSISQAEQAFSSALTKITIEDLLRRADTLLGPAAAPA